jgi:hypothetical protein
VKEEESAREEEVVSVRKPPRREGYRREPRPSALQRKPDKGSAR